MKRTWTRTKQQSSNSKNCFRRSIHLRSIAQSPSVGETVFNNNCVQCHGQHDRDHDDLPIYVAPQFIGLDEVGTDEVRAKVYDDEVRQRVSESPLASYIQPTENREGYIAPNLWGVWSRFPYLHNGSVANMEDLLTPPEKPTNLHQPG